MALTDVEREIIKTVVERFLNMQESTPRKLLVRRYRSLDALRRLTDFPILKKVNSSSASVDEDYLPRALAFHYSGDRDTITRARTSVEIVLRVLQNMFDVEMEKVEFTTADVEAHAKKMFDTPPAASVIKLGLYLSPEFGALLTWSPNSSQTEATSIRIAESIVEIKDFGGAWDSYVARQAPYIDNPQSFDEELELPTVDPAQTPDLQLPPTVMAKMGGMRSLGGARTGLGRAFTSAFDTYSVMRQVGCGGSGTVFEVKDASGQRLALKMLDRSKVSRNKLKRFQNEIQFCMRPTLKRIVRVLDYGITDEGSLFYVMPFYSSTLRAQIKSGIPTEDVLRLYSCVLDSVDEAHLLGACHRDIKPENILYEVDTKDLVLADFGIARFKEEDLATTINTGPHERLANFAYAAPEQRSAGNAVDHRADIYALGLILNEMYTGSVPQGTEFQHIKDVAPNYAYLDELADLMMRHKAEQRPQSVAEVKEKLVARGNEFVRFQQLDQLRKEVVPDSEIRDPLIDDPTRPVHKETYHNGTLVLKLNRAVNPIWEACFRKRATSFTMNVSSAVISFHADKAHVMVPEHFLQEGVNFLKEYCVLANEEYASHVKLEHQREIAQRRSDLRNRVAETEARMKLLDKVQI